MAAEAQGQMTSQLCLGLTLTSVGSLGGHRCSWGHHLELELGSSMDSMLSQKGSGGDWRPWGTGQKEQAQVTAPCYPRQVKREGGGGQGDSRS